MDRAFSERLADPAPVVLDGGLATSLEDDGHDLSGALWSARLLLDDPDAVAAVHRRFADAGAEVVTTASYQLSARSLAAGGGDPARAGELIASSIAVARAAVGTAAFVAASIGPFGASLADGSEYRGRYGLARAALAAFHAPRVEAAVAGGADLLACETIPSGDEVAALADVLAGSGVPAWVSVTVAPDGTTTPEGQPVAEAIAPAAALDEVVAVGVNCCPPAAAEAALPHLAHLGLPLVVAPNLGRRWHDGRWVRTSDRPDPTVWLAAGARIVGGCCGTGADDVRRLVAALR